MKKKKIKHLKLVSVLGEKKHTQKKHLFSNNTMETLFILLKDKYKKSGWTLKNLTYGQRDMSFCF